jgi:hypothetical protein
VLSLTIPAWVAGTARAQTALPRTASAAPASTAVFSEVNLDMSGPQWQQTQDLLARVGVPNALDLWREQILKKGERKGDFTAADLDALLGGEMAIIVSPAAIEHLVNAQMVMAEHSGTPEPGIATPEAMTGEMGQGITVVLLPSDPGAAWDYAQRQINTFADKQGVEVTTTTHGSAEILSVTAGNAANETNGAMEDPYDVWLGHHGQGGLAIAHAGEFIVAGKTPADVGEIVDVIDGSGDSLANHASAQEVAASLPAEALSFTYVDSQAILNALGSRAIGSIEAFLPAGMTMSSLGGASGMTLSADQPGFRFESVTLPAEGGTIEGVVAPNDAAVAEAARQAPAGTFLFEAGKLTKSAFAGLPLAFSQVVNAAMAGPEAQQHPQNAFPSAEDVQAEIEKAAATLEFDPRADLFDLLGDEFIAFTNFPSFGSGGIDLNAAAAITTTNPAELAVTAKKFAAWIDRSVPDVDVSVRQVGNDTVYVIRDPQMSGSPALEVGVVGDRAVIGIGNGIAELQATPANSLADDAQFQQVMATLPGEFSQVAYVDLSRVMGLAMMMTGNMGFERDADLACADYADQAAAQAALEASPVANGNLDRNGNGQACEDAFATPGATPVASQGSLQNIRALGAVTFEQDGKARMSGILYIAGSGA